MSIVMNAQCFSYGIPEGGCELGRRRNVTQRQRGRLRPFWEKRGHVLVLCVTVVSCWVEALLCYYLYPDVKYHLKNCQLEKGGPQ